jgi:phosphopantothenoylcysteine synthetase/decarboxylase
MNVLITAGNTLVPIDRVRCVTNVFTGRTGTAIALYAHNRGHRVTLLTSHPEAVADQRKTPIPLSERWLVYTYRTFEDLQSRMAATIPTGGFDCIIHCAAVSDYLSAGVFSPSPGTTFHPEDNRWEGPPAESPALIDRSAGKVKSDEPELWLRLVRAPKLIDQIRTDWGFHGLLVKFKLEVGVPDDRLLEIGEQSRLHSAADLMVSNTLEGASVYAFLGPLAGAYQRVSRRELAGRLLDALEQLHAARQHG